MLTTRARFTMVREQTSELEDGSPGRVLRAMLVADLVESVRLMDENEDATIKKWRACVQHVHDEILPAHSGRMVKSYGDGFLLDFDRPHDAAGAAHALQTWIHTLNEGAAPQERLALRCGLHVARVVVDERDLYGAGVNLTSRMAALAEPGGIVASEGFCDQLVEGLDGRLVDLGMQYFKHVSEPVHCFELRQAGSSESHRSTIPTLGPLLPTIAIVPFAAEGSASALGAILSDRLIVALGELSSWCVVSRLSSLGLRSRNLSVRHARQVLKADFCLTGRCSATPSGLRIEAELTSEESSSAVWSDAFECALDDLAAEQSVTVLRLSESIARTILDVGIKGVQGLPMQSLSGYALLLGSVQQMHRLSVVERDLALRGLQHLVSRYPRSADVHAWLGKWHFLRIAQVDGADVNAEAISARKHLNAALDLDPRHGLARALHSHMFAFVDRDLAAAEAGLREAVAIDPNEPMAWLFLGQALALRQAGDEALAAIDIADRLSPLDPMRYFVEMFKATALLCQGRYLEATVPAQRSVELNSLHLPGLTVLIIAQQLAGMELQAQANARRYLALRPAASVARYRSNYPVPDSHFAQQAAAALRDAGIPD
jgi:adenylate cyclase